MLSVHTFKNKFLADIFTMLGSARNYAHTGIIKDVSLVKKYLRI